MDIHAGMPLRARACVGLVFAAALGACPLARAQFSPPGTPQSEERRQQERNEQLQRQQQRHVDERLPTGVPAVAPRLPEDESPCFPLRAVQWTGLQALVDEDDLRAALAGAGDPPWNRCLGPRAFGQLADRAQNHLIAAGYVTTRVLVPEQSVADGTLTLAVLPGRVGAIRAAEPGMRLPGAAPLQPGAVLNLRAMEQALENFRRVPTVQAEIRIEPSPDATLGPGWSDVVVAWTQPRQWRAALTLDDGGSKATGVYQASATFSLDNPLHANDLFYATLTHDAGGGSDGERGTRGRTLHYSVPWGWWLLGATWTGSRYRQQVAGTSQTYVYAGRSETLEIKGSYLLRRDAASKTSLHLKAFFRTSANFIDDTEIQLQRRRVAGWEAGLSHRVFFGDASADLSLAARKGTGAFGAREAPENASGEGTSRFLLWTLDAAATVPLKWGDTPLRFTSQWRAQWNRTPLTPQDRFSIGGRYTVRGFSGERTLLGERGWLARNELAAPLGASGHEVFAGLDHGEVDGASAAALAGRTLTGVVAGLRGSMAVGGTTLSYELFAGQPLRKPARFDAARTSGGFQLTWAF